MKSRSVNDSDFGSTFSYMSGPLDPYVAHTAHVVVDAWDDPVPNVGNPNWSFDVTLNLPVCQQPTEPPVTEPPVTEEPSFEKSFAAETDVPTQPPTATIGGGTSGPTDGTWLLLVALGAALATLVMRTPARVCTR